MVLIAATLFTVSLLASDAQMYFASDKNGQNRVTNIQEGDEIFIVVIDNDQNIDCDVRDKMWPDLKIFDPKTGGYIVWDPRGGTLADDYLEETGADTGVFVSKRSFQVGTRESYAQGTPNLFAHVVDVPVAGVLDDFQWGHWEYVDDGDADGYADEREWLDYGPVFHANQAPPALFAPADVPSNATLAEGPYDYIIGRFENMDTLVGLYQDPNDVTDVALGLMKIIDTEATISWDQTIYKDANTSATITVVDPDENLNCNEVEFVPVFILINPGSWNPWDAVTASPTNFCMLLRQGGVSDTGNFPTAATVLAEPVRWYNIYDSGLAAIALDTQAGSTPQPNNDAGVRYVQYPNTTNAHDGNGAVFDTVTTSGVTRIQFYAQETGVSTGVFQLNLNSLLVDLGFDQLYVRDVLVAYYLDPNDFDDFKLATAYIEEQQHSNTTFTDAARAPKGLYWIGRDPVYVQVIDANANVDPCCPEQVVVHVCDPHGEDDSEWLILDETSSNSPVFFSFAGTQLWPVWDALGVGLADSNGGFLLQLDNWKIEAFNEDSIYVRYNDVYYETDTTGMAGLGDVTSDSTANTAFPPAIDRIRVANDVSFDLMEVGDTQVYDGTAVNMYFLDRQGNRVAGYVNSDCVFVEVIDPDQDEDQFRRERIDGFWDGYQNLPFGPMDYLENHEACGYLNVQTHSVNALLGDTNIFESDDDTRNRMERAKLYVLNPRNGRWAAVDLMETGIATGDFVSVICIDLVGVYDCAPTLGVLPGDTILAAYQDPSNHSDSAWISIKVGIGGAGTPPSQQSTTMFVDADGNEVADYTDADLIYVKVIDPSHAGATVLPDAVEIDGMTYDLSPLAGAQNDTFITAGLDLGAAAGDTITATYEDPTDPTDTSSDTITIVASVLAVDEFYAAPNPFDDEAAFGYTGSGIASVMSVAVYDLTGTMVWSDEQTNVSEIVWNGTDSTGVALANGAYLYTITATDGTNTFHGKGLVFVNR